MPEKYFLHNASRRSALRVLTATATGVYASGIAAKPLDRSAWKETSITPRRPPDIPLSSSASGELFLGFGFAKETPQQPDWDRYLTVLQMGQTPSGITRIAVPHGIHGIVPLPQDSTRVVALQKRGHGASLINMLSGEVERSLTKPMTRQFYGHGVFSADGSVLFNTETDLSKDYRGLLVVRDGRSLAPIGSIPSHGASPHDLQLIDNGKVIVITNGGGPLNLPKAAKSRPNVAFVEVASGRLLERLEFDAPHLNAGHLRISNSGDLVTVSSFRDGLEDRPDVTGGISIRPQGTEFKTLSQPAELVNKLFGETLSTEIDEHRGIFATTTPQANTLAFWELATGRLLHAEYLPQPKGIALREDGSAYVVSYTYKGRALVGEWSASTLRRLPDRDLIDVYISGSHLVRHRITV